MYGRLETVAGFVKASMDDGALVAEPSGGQAQGLMQVAKRGAAQVPEFDSLQVVPDALTGPNLLHLPWYVSDSMIDAAELRAGGRQRTRCLDG